MAYRSWDSSFFFFFG
uniref:Uncharacterized protein MANES_14G157900 n=1 Tax=Rhizophora mucronata TaxID=61149 RepID=A0A2P2KII7_RHIMU